jgi:hypothetical protein
LRERDNVGKQHSHCLSATGPERFVLSSQQVDNVRGKIARKIVSRSFSGHALPVHLAQLCNIGQRFADRDLEIAQINQIDDEIEGTKIYLGSKIHHVS